MEILHSICLLLFLVNIFEISANQIPSRRRNSADLLCTFSDGQRCTTILRQKPSVVGRDGWRVQQALSNAEEYYAHAACPGQCQDSLTVLQGIRGSPKPLLLSFYYNIWTLSTSLSSANHRVAIDNIAISYGFSSKVTLSRPTYEIPKPMGMTDGPMETTDAMLPEIQMTSNMATRLTGYSTTLSTDTTEDTHIDEVPYRTLAMADGLNRNIQDHVAYKPVIAMLFILLICSTTIIIHILICKNQRRISSRLRRVSASVLSPGEEQYKISPEVFVSSYSSTHASSEPRAVSFLSQNGEQFPVDEEQVCTKPKTKEATKRSMSIACVDRLTKPSKLRPHGRANTTPSKSKDDLYESIDGSSPLTVAEESVSRKLLRKISPARLPRFLDSSRPSSSDLQGRPNIKETFSSNSSSLLSVTFDPTSRDNRKLNANCLTPPLPPRTYSIGGETDTKRSNSTSQLAAPNKGSSSSQITEFLRNQKETDCRRWSDVAVGGRMQKDSVDPRGLSPELKDFQDQEISSLTSRETLVAVENDNEHDYFVLQRPARDGCDVTEIGSLDADSVASENDDSHKYHILDSKVTNERHYSSSVDVESIGDGSSLVESNAYQSLGGSLCSHHTYQSLEHQESGIMADESFEKHSAPSVSRQSSLTFGETPSTGARSNQREGGVEQKVTYDNGGYSIPIIQTVSCDGNPAYGHLQHEEHSCNNTKDRDTVSVTSDNSGYNHLVRGDYKLSIDTDAESSGGYDHIQK